MTQSLTVQYSQENIYCTFFIIVNENNGSWLFNNRFKRKKRYFAKQKMKGITVKFMSEVTPQKTKIKNIFFIKLWQTNDAPGNSLCSSILNHFPHSARICNQVSSRSYQFFWSEKVFVGLIFYLNTYLHTIIFYQLK